MIKAVSIMLNRAEGPTAHTGRVTITDAPLWENADRQLSRWRVTASPIGYDKTDLVVTFADGETYEGCYLLGRFDSLPLAEHVRGFLRTAVTNKWEDGFVVENWLATYNLTDEEA